MKAYDYEKMEELAKRLNKNMGDLTELELSQIETDVDINEKEVEIALADVRAEMKRESNNDLNKVSLRSMINIKKTEEELYEVSCRSIGRMTSKKQEGIKYSIGQISNWVTKWIMVTPNDIRKALILDGYTEGTNKQYSGLTCKDSKEIEEFANEPTSAKVFEVSFKHDKACHAAIQNCVWSDENINKFRYDMIMIGRLYQEKTIDYAKKLCFLDIINSPMRHIHLLSIEKMNISLVGDKIVITPPAVNEDKIVVNDIINKTRMAFADEYKDIIENEVMPLINKASLPKDMAAELQRRRYGDTAAFIDMKAYYKDVVGGYIRVQEDIEAGEEDESISIAKESFKDDKDRIENMIRMATQYMTSEERGSYMKYIAGRTKNNQKREDGSENRFYLSLCREEFLKWLISMKLNEIDFAGYKLLGNKEYVEGDIVWFEEGQAGKAIIDGTYTGWLTIKEYNKAMYATVDIDDLVVVPGVSNKILVKVKQSFVRDKGADRIIRSLNTCTDVAFKTGKNNYVMEVTRPDGTSTPVPYDLGPTFFNMLKDVSGKIVKVSKNTVTSEKGDIIDSVYISIDLDVIPESVAPIGAPEVTEEDPISFVVEETDEL